MFSGVCLTLFYRGVPVPGIDCEVPAFDTVPVVVIKKRRLIFLDLFLGVINKMITFV